MSLKILLYPDPVLREISKPIKNISEEIQDFAKKMLETMYSARGVGLAAPQVGRLERLVVIDTRPRDEDGNSTEEGMTEFEKTATYPLILINPEIKKKEGKNTYEEGCLSIPGYTEKVERAKLIEAEYTNEKGERVQIKTDGLLAICIQHEIDHLNGKLFIDRLSFLKSNRIKDRIKKYGYEKREENSSVL